MESDNEHSATGQILGPKSAFMAWLIKAGHSDFQASVYPFLV